MSDSKRPKQITELTGFRFFAAFHVLLHHNAYLAGAWNEQTPQPVHSAFAFGSSAVALFFILSGFILTYVYCNPDGSLRASKKRFGFARFARLYPVYALAFLLDAPRVIRGFLEQGDALVASVKLIVSGTAHVLMIQSWHPRVTTTWNTPAWSLSCEAFFYVTFPFVATRILRSQKVRFWTFALPVYALPLVLYAVLSPHLALESTDNPAFTFWRSFPPLRLSEFLLGIFLGKFFIAQSQKGFRHPLLEPTGATIAFWSSTLTSLALIAFPLAVPYPIYTSALLVPCFAVMIISLASGKVMFVGPFRWPALILLGQASYVLYIIHQPIKTYVEYALVRMGVEHGAFAFAVYVLTTVGASILVYRLLERPAQRWLMARFKRATS